MAWERVKDTAKGLMDAADNHFPANDQASNTMKQALFGENLHVEYETNAPIPQPRDNEVIIRAQYAGINPIDWKGANPKVLAALHAKYHAPVHKAQGKDFAGVVHAVGKKVFNVKPGDRVTALNHSSGFAEYSVGFSHTTALLPDNTSLEEATAFGLPYYTAALSLWKGSDAPAPWNRAKNGAHNPVLIYGASSAVGAYTVKLAALANMHPIIAIAGKAAQATIGAVIDPAKGDVILDYRQHNGSASLVSAIQKAAGGKGFIKYAFDVICTEATINEVIGKVLDPEGSHYSWAVGNPIVKQFPAATTLTNVGAPGLFEETDPDGPDGANGSTNEGSRAWATVASSYLTFALIEGLITPHPHKLLPNGLGSLEQGLQEVKAGKNESLRYVMKIDDTPW